MKNIGAASGLLPLRTQPKVSIPSENGVPERSYRIPGPERRLAPAEFHNRRDLARQKRQNPSIPQIEKLPHLAKLLVPRIQQFQDGLIRQRHQLPVQHFIQKPCRRLMVGMCAAFRFRHDFVHNSQLGPRPSRPRPSP